MRLLYVSNARIPSPMAHGLQIVQNCEAFADAGAQVTLWCANRKTPASEGASPADAYRFYGVKQNFTLKRLPTLDLPAMFPRAGKLTAPLFYVQVITFALAALLRLLFMRPKPDMIYSRDPLVLLMLSLITPREKLAYEAHRFNQPGRGRWLQKQMLKRVGHIIAITPPLAERLDALQANHTRKARLMVAHDGIRAGRFAHVTPQAEARAQVGIPPDAFIMGYVGRLKTMGMDKGIDTLIDALARLPHEAGVSLALVGGPDDVAAQYRQRWLALGLPESRFVYAGQVDAARVPLYLNAFDVCAMPFPFNEHYAYYMSPIKLFEYMASGRALIATDLPSIADVVQHEVNALVITPESAEALAAAILRLREDSALRVRLADAARARVMDAYTWGARAQQIMAFLRG